MKSIKLLIVSLVMFMLLPLVAFADAGGPSFTTYSARVINKDGTCLLDWNSSGSLVKGKCYNFDDIIENIYYEEKIDGEYYGSTSEGIVKLSDIIAVSDKIDFSNFDNTKGEYYVFKEITNIYKGPSKTYGKVDSNVTIPVGTILKYTYSDDLFSYIEYNGVKGWIFSYQDGNFDPYEGELCVARSKTGRVYIVNNANIYSSPVSKEKTGSTIIKDTYVEYKYVSTVDGTHYAYYVNYNGNKGWIIEAAEDNNIAIIEKNSKIFTHLEDAKICKNTDKTCSQVGTIPKNTIVKVEYYINWRTSSDDLAWFYVKYNGVSGWVHHKEYVEGKEDSLYFYNGEYDARYQTVVLEAETVLYDNIYGKETKTSIPAGEYDFDFSVYDNSIESNWYHITSGKNTGWIKVNDNYDNPGQGIDIDEPTEPDDDVDTPKNRDYEPKGLVIGETVTYALIGAFGLGVVIIVLIVILNNYSNKVTKKTKEQKDSKENNE